MDPHTSSTSSAIILAAGRGTRMGSLTRDIPKCLVPVFGIPLLHHLIDRAAQAGVAHFIVVVEHLAQAVIDSVVNLPYDITCVVQSSIVGNRYGTAAALEAGLTQLSTDNAVVLSADSLYSVEVLRRLQKWSDVAMCASPASSVIGFGEVVFHKTILTHLIEKPVDDHAGHINIGAYHFTSAFFDYLSQVKPSARGEYELTDALVEFARLHPVHVQLIDSAEWTTVTSPQDISRVEEYARTH